MTCHAAIVSRELGVPAVVGARTATTVLRDGELVTVDGAQGTVTEGAVGPRGGRIRSRRGAGRIRCRRPRGAGHEDLRQPGLRRARRGGGRAARGRRRPAAGRVHGHRRPDGGAPAQAPGAGGRGRRSSTPWPSRCCRSRGPSSRGRSSTAASTSARTSSPTWRAASKFEPHEENPMIGYRGCYRYVREPDLFRLELERARPRAAGDAEHRADDPVRAHGLGARGLPRGGRRQPGRRLPPGVGDGRGALGRLLDPDLRRHGDRRRVDRQQRPDPADARASTGTPRSAPRSSTRPTRPSSTRSGASSGAASPRASRPRCAARPRPTGRPSPSISSASGSPPSRSTPTRWRPCARPWRPPNGGCCSRLRSPGDP